ncbi:MAG: hypothetical protein J5805_01360 [Bacteroidaceae bacterium]|nr:hypothetical protein [Bacteroidaceae bacterium]
MKKIYKLFISAAVICCPISLTITSCSDTWDEHFDENSASSNQSILELIESDEELSDFLEVLRATHVYNNNRPTSVTYADLIGKDQSLTVWAPKNGTFNKDSLLNECLTQKGDSMVGQHFAGNHIARTPFDSQKIKDNRFYMINSKRVYGENINLQDGEINIPAKNGLLHIVKEEIPYSYSLYEAITTLKQFDKVSSIFKAHEQVELDENASKQLGIEDGKIVYSDSVLRRYNIFYSVFGRINDEDSSFFALLPYENDWNNVYNDAKQYFNYGSIEKADSLSDLYTNISLMEPLFYNRNMQHHIKDSIFSTSYYREEPEYNVFYNPFDEGGLLSDTHLADSMDCSNGKIYMLRQWPFTKEQTFLRPITTEVEDRYYLIDNKDCTLDYKTSLGDSVSNHGYVTITEKNNKTNWNLTYKIYSNLSASYDLYVVVLPKTVANPYSRDFKLNKFKVSVKYPDLEGNMLTKSFDGSFTNDPYRVDTIKIGTITFPVCTYANRDASVSIIIKSDVGTKATDLKTYSRNMLLDCIYLKPTEEKEDAE